MVRQACVGIGAAVLCGLTGTTQADFVVVQEFSLSNGLQSATATFTFSDIGGDKTLNILLTNTMTTNAPPNWLTGVFFDIAGGPTLSNGSALAPDGMVTFDASGSTPYITNGPGNFWAFRQDLAGVLPPPFVGQQYGLGSAGFNVFSSNDMLDLPVPVDIHPQRDGSDGGIVPFFGGGETVPEGHFQTPFVLGSLAFDFDLPDLFDINAADASNVFFVFGTGFEEIVLLPLPAALPMGLAGLLGVLLLRRASKRASQH